ncbi:MAG: radical SAM protein [Desulfobacteraceae bacterium]|nr:radical SAM protein [Desulfobacteraceae bacterium]
MDCPHIPIIPYSEFSKSIHDRIAAERIPISGTIEITHRCNLNCVHCYSNLPASDKTAAQQELTYREICDIIDQLVKEECLWLLLTGGEPLIRKDFIDIYTYAKDKGMIITLFTNGTLITPQIADYLKEWPPFSVEITLYGITKETYERVTGVPGSFERCLEGIHFLLERKIPLKLKTTVTTLNRDELWKIKEYVESLGVEFRFDPVLNPRLDGSKEPCRFRISPEEVVKLDLVDEKRLKGWLEFCQKFWGPPSTDRLYACGAGQTSFYIDPYGGLNICILSRNPSYNLRQGAFQEGWYGFIPEILEQKPKGEYKCAKCELLSLCGQCPGWAQLENGDPQKPVEYLCQLAHLRAEAFGINKRRKKR